MKTKSTPRLFANAKGLLRVVAIALACSAPCVGGQVQPDASKLDRTVLPIPEPKPPTITELDARDAKPPPRFEVKRPEGRAERRHRPARRHRLRPVSAFGGPIKMPTLDKLAAAGLRYNDFHTTALCSPTRTALLTGRNHHVNNAGRDHGTGDRVPGQHRHPPAERRAAGRDAAPQRLQHRRLRQVSRDAAVGSLGLRSVRSLADAFRLRQVLRLHRRRDQPMGAGDLRRHHPRRTRNTIPTTTSPST